MDEKKIAVKPLPERRNMMDRECQQISQRRQCALLSLHRSGLYYKPQGESEENLSIMRLLDEQYFHTPFYGAERLTRWLLGKGYHVNVKRIRRLMKKVNWKTLYRKRSLSKPQKGNAVYPYLLRGMKITHSNQVWAIDITYIPMKHGFLYLCAVIDLCSRYVVNWSVSNSMSAEWCREVVEEAIEQYGLPEIINSDQGSQFTSFEYTELLKEKGIQISMDSKGRALDNIFIERLWKSVKYECVYLHAFEDGVKLYEGLKKYFSFYNSERLHQSLSYQTPEAKYRRAA